MQNKNNYFLIMTRYLIYLLMAMCSFFYLKLTYKGIYCFIVIFFIYVINTEVRIFYLKDKKHILFSIIMDIILATVIYSYINNFIFIFYFVSIIDAAVMLPRIYSYPLFLAFGIVISFKALIFPFNLNSGYNLINVLFSIILIITLGFMGENFREENRRKLEAQKLYDKLRISEEKLKEAYDKLERYSETVEELSILRERNRISREIHDAVGHTLSAILIQLQALNYVFENDKEEGIRIINDMIEYVKSGIENVRRTVRKLKPTDFDRYEGIFAIEEMIRKHKKLTGVDIRFIVSKEKRPLTSDESFISYRIIQEALNNAVRHGKASFIEVSFQFFEDRLYIRIKDNGIGTDKLEKSFGITGMEERVGKLGGTIEIETAKNKGFEITVNIPRVNEEKNIILNN